MDVESVSINQNSKEGGKHPNRVSVDTLPVRTKNGLVNGVTSEKCKANKKQSKFNNHLKKVKKEELKVKIDELDLSENVEKSSEEYDLSEKTNCIKSDNSNEICKIEKSAELSQSKLNQSNSSSTSKSETKRKKSKAKKMKTEEIIKEHSNLGAPKFDINSLTSVNLDSLISNTKLSENMPSSSQFESSKSRLLDCGSSDFEKNLIESIKSLKIQNESQIEEVKSESVQKTSESEEHPQQEHCDISYVQYESELQMPMIMKIIQKDLSEPYSIYTYRYFIHNWPKLCFLAMCGDKCVGAIVCKLDYHRKSIKRGYIAMLAVDKDYRKRSIGSTLVRRAISEMIAGGADEVVLETEVTNKPALRLYEQLGFVRDKRLFRYYLNGVDALRLKLWLR